MQFTSRGLPSGRDRRDRIRAGLADIDPRLASEHDYHEGSRKQLSNCAGSLLVDRATLYARTLDEHGKRLANQALDQR